jgi:hypothetical protein
MVKEIQSPYIQPKGRGPSGVGLAHLLQEDGFDLVIIMAGTNDLGQSKDPMLTNSLVTRLHKACHAFGIPTVNIVPPTVSERGAFADATRIVREARSRLAQSMNASALGSPNVLLSFDCETIVPKGMRCLWEPDDIHLSPAGAKELANKLASQLPTIFGQLDIKVSPAASLRSRSPQLRSSMQACTKPIGSTMAFKTSSKKISLSDYNAATAAMTPGVLALRKMTQTSCIY